MASSPNNISVASSYSAQQVLHPFRIQQKKKSDLIRSMKFPAQNFFRVFGSLTRAANLCCSPQQQTLYTKRLQKPVSQPAVDCCLRRWYSPCGKLMSFCCPSSCSCTLLPVLQQISMSSSLVRRVVPEVMLGGKQDV